jgi:hypothetical protein
LEVDKEARLHGTTMAEHPQELRLWLRLLTCTQLIETQVRAGLRERFDTTLPRFDLMAQLERSPAGLKMNELSTSQPSPTSWSPKAWSRAVTSWATNACRG